MGTDKKYQTTYSLILRVNKSSTNTMATERTFIMIKPDGVARNLVAKIIERFEQRGYKLVAMKFMQASTDLLNQHYADLSSKPFFPSLVKHIASGPVVPMVWEGKDVVRQGRVLLGETDPLKSKPGSIRGDFSIDMGRNIIHGSDSVESALNEIGLWFSAEELVEWAHPLHAATYEYITAVCTKPVAKPPPMLAFGDLSTSSGLKALNEHLATRSYIEGYVPCQADVSTLYSLASSPSAEYCHIARWYRQIKSYSAKELESFPVLESTLAPAPAAAKADEDDDFDMFGSDEEEEEETEEEKKIREERLAAYHAKKSTKKAVIAKSSLLLDVKPWDDETDMVKLEECVRTVQCDGLVWGQSKLVAVGYGIKKLQICAVIEDDKVSTDWLDDEITKFEDHVQSMDIAKFNKI